VLAETGVAVPPSSTPLFVTSWEQGMLVLPQTTDNAGDDNVFDPGDFAIEVKYMFSDWPPQTRYVMIGDGYPFVANNQYRININFTGSAIEFAIDIEDFEAPLSVTTKD
jgi:hypothetical protein